MNHDLIDRTKPHGKVTFIHFADKKEHTFYSAVNRLTGDRLTGYDNDPPYTSITIGSAKDVFRNIRIKSQVVKYEGTKHFQ